MQCVGLSVVRGTTISQFNVEVIDVIGAQAGLSGPRILVRASGPAVDATGIGPGFSGSPILCPGAGGIRANAGAISESIGEYGNHVVLVTPIEEMLRDPPATPAAASARRGSALARSARPLGILTVSGLSPRTRGLLARAAQRAGTAVLAAPAGPLGGFPRQELGRRRGGRDAVHGRHRARRGRHGHVPRRPRIWAFGHASRGSAGGRCSSRTPTCSAWSRTRSPSPTSERAPTSSPPPEAMCRARSARTRWRRSRGPWAIRPPGFRSRVVARESGGEGRWSSSAHSWPTSERSVSAPACRSRPRSAPHRRSSSCSATSGPPPSRCAYASSSRGRPKPLGYCNPYFDAFTPLDDLIAASSLVDAFDRRPHDRARVGEHPRPSGRQFGRADLRPGAPPGRGRQAREGPSDAAAPKRRPPHAQASGSHPAGHPARPAHAAPLGHERWVRLGRGCLPAGVLRGLRRLRRRLRAAHDGRAGTPNRRGSPGRGDLRAHQARRPAPGAPSPTT